ncbi:MAG: methylenetetrahydrofolate reductase [NAD(P)H] [Sedimenticola sp.]|jgi:methylenetetrahydrofolate reductase (NADPH)|nr:MAG: methylenetetrahydrofolate reductase [NAD(P)H] [Sedimenticola sp.]
MESQKKYTPTFSFELFPPKTEAGMEKLQTNVMKLSVVNPLYFSVTYGAGGSTQERTFESVNWLVAKGFGTAPHISCVGSSREKIIEILTYYKSQNIKRVVALRGDLPSGAGLGGVGELNYANELVALIRSEFGDYFHIEVAAYPEFHPQAGNANSDLQNFKRKVDAGASAAITQYFYNPDAYFRFIESCEKLGIDIPIVPGIMPISNYTQLARFSDSCGTEIPRWMRKRFEAMGDDIDSIKSFGLDVVTTLCDRLLEQGAPGLHFYTMNQSHSVLKIWNNLGL